MSTSQIASPLSSTLKCKGKPKLFDGAINEIIRAPLALSESRAERKLHKAIPERENSPRKEAL